MFLISLGDSSIFGKKIPANEQTPTHNQFVCLTT
jgi:hypothetical protein